MKLTRVFGFAPTTSQDFSFLQTELWKPKREKKLYPKVQGYSEWWKMVLKNLEINVSGKTGRNEEYFIEYICNNYLKQETGCLDDWIALK